MKLAGKKKYISVSSKPGTFGKTIFNLLFQKYDINAEYNPMIAPSAKELAQFIRTNIISGCAVSMPLKEVIVPELDEVDSLVKSTNSCNTILNRDGILKGYNTDIIGFENALKRAVNPSNIKNALIYGTGGVVPSVVHALRNLDIDNIFINGRNRNELLQKSKKLEIEIFEEQIASDLFINCTPLSLEPDKNTLDLLATKCGIVFDLVVSATETPFLERAKSMDKSVIPGWLMAMHQLKAQFWLYEKIESNDKELEDLVKTNYLKLK